MQVTFETNQYEFAHGKLPRGTGSWVFEVVTHSNEQRNFLLSWPSGLIEIRPVETRSVQLWIKRETSFADAKAIVKNFLRGHFTHHVSVRVCS